MKLRLSAIKVGLLTLCAFFAFISPSLSEDQASNSTPSNIPPPSNCMAAPDPIVITQPDGSQLTIVGKGNMTNSWVETVDGYSIIRDANGIYHYAQKVNGQLVPTTTRVNEVGQRTAAEQTFISSLQKSIKPDLDPLKTAVLNQVRNGLQNKTYPTTGNIRILALLIDYPDLTNTYGKASFDSLLYGTNYRNGDQSFKTFYDIASNGQLNMTIDVMGWFRSDSLFTHYGNANGFDKAADLAREAVDAAEAAGANFANYDNDNDGDVDGILVVHSGPGAEQGAQTQYIWSHRWVLAGGNLGAVTYDGVSINDYMMNPETRTGNALVGIGVFCHEFGHNLGLPDLYDTDASNGDSEGIGNWCLMAGGTWLGGEHQPCNFSAWCREENGWDTPTTLAIGNSGVFNLDPASLHQNEMYRINTALSNEYFLIENRQTTGLDTALVGTGLAIWHINTNKTNAFGNSVNADENLKGVDLEEADGLNDLDNEVNRGDAGDLYPGSSNNTSFDDTSNPNSQTYTSANTGLMISNIVESGDQISFQFGAVVNTCSGLTTITNTSGTFDDGSGNSNYGDNLSCSWLLQPPGMDSIVLNFTSFALMAGDQLVVYDGNSNAAPVLGTLTGMNVPAPISSSGGELFLEFTTNGSNNAAGWEISHSSFSTASSTTCSGQTVLTNPSGIISDGSGTANYGDNLDCSWLVQPASTNTFINLFFSQLDTEVGNDTVTIYDGTTTSDPIIGTYSGNTLPPPPISTSGSNMLVTFKTNGSTNGQGWTLQYGSTPITPTCTGSTTLNSPSSSFDDGSGTRNYTNSLNCSWLIQPANTDSITLNFNAFDVDASDQLVVYDGSTNAAPVLATLTGSALPSSITSSTGNMFLEFTTDASNTAAGWDVSYVSFATPLTPCSGLSTLTASNGTLQDGSGTNDYLNNQNCSWLIQPLASGIINLDFTSFNTEATNDVVSVYAGTNNSAPLLGSFSGSSVPSTVSTNAGAMFVEFITNGSVTAPGWEANYYVSTGSCTGITTLINPSGTFEDGSGLGTNYADNLNCQWLIQPPGARSITLTFNRFDVENFFDEVNVYDGTTTGAPLLGTFTGNTLPPSVTASNAMLVEFTSDFTVTREGWEASYRSSTTSCSGLTTLTSNTGTITDGSGTTNYDDNLNCQWLIQPPSAANLLLNFNAIDIAAGDTLYVYEGNSSSAPLVGAYSGTTIPGQVTTTGGSYYLEFITNANTVAQGWSVSYSSGSCAGTTALTATSGSFDDGSGVNNYTENLNCNWLIQPAGGAAFIDLTFNSFNLAFGDFVRVYDGTNTGGTLLGTFTGTFNPGTVSASSGSMFLEFTTNATNNSAGWDVSYSTRSTVSCSGLTTFTAPSGSFDDGSGANNYDNNLSCSWLIQPSNGNQVITLDFTSVNLSFGDFVRVYNGPTNASPQIGFVSGSAIPATMTATGGSMFVEFTSNGSATAQGWDATYNSSNSTCSGQTVLTANGGSFDDGSGTSGNYTNNLDCEWLIQPATPNQIIRLTLFQFSTEAVNDSVTVYDGATTSDPILGTFSGSTNPPQLFSSGGSMLVTFKTNASVVNSGWRAFYNTLPAPACSGTTNLTAASGNFDDGSGTANYDNNSNCQWLIQPTGAISTTLTFTSFNVDNRGGDIVEVYDGATTSAPLLGSYNGTTLPPVLQGGGQMLVRFSTDNFFTAPGWEANYTSSNVVQLDVSPDTVFLLGSAGATGSATITANIDWTVTDNGSWLIPSPVNGNGNATLNLLAISPNIGPDRTALVFIDQVGGNEKDTLVVIQRGTGNFMAPSVDTVRLANPANSTGNFDVLASVNWNLSSSASWFNISPTSGSNNQTIVVTASSSNSMSADRSDIIVMTGSSGVANDTVVVVQDGVTIIPQLSVSPNNIPLAAASGSNASVTVTSNTSWTASPNVTWLNVAPSSGTNSASVTITAISANTNPNSRDGFVVFTDMSGTITDTVFVNQLGTGPSILVTPDNVTLADASGSNTSVVLTANVNWSSAANVTWLTVNPNTGSGNSTVVVTANSANTIAADRDGFVVFTEVGGTEDDTLFVTQQGASPNLTLNPRNITVASSAGSNGVSNLTTNTNWTATSSAAWLDPTPLSGSGNTTITATANSDNNTGATRDAYIVVADDNSSLTDTLFVSQFANNKQLSGSPRNVTLAAANGSTANASVTANVSWTATPNVTWFSVGPNSGTGSGALTITANSANSGMTARSGYIVLNEVGGTATDTIFVNQDPPNAFLSVNPRNLTLANPANSNASFAITSNSAWTVSPDGFWLTVNPINGMNNGNVTVTANSANASSVARTSFVVVSINGGALTDTVFISQDGRQDNLSVSPNNVTIGPFIGDNTNLNLTANISWTASTPATWMNVAPISGTSSSTIIVTATADNLTGSSRTDTITFSGLNVPDQKVAVTQIDGSNPFFDISTDTVYLNNSQGSTETFDVLSNTNWQLTENSGWLLITPFNGSNTQTITVLSATRNSFGNTREATITASANGFPDRTITVIQAGVPPLFSVAPSTIFLASDSLSTKTFSISSNLLAWTITNNASWLEVSPSSGSFTELITAKALSTNRASTYRSETLMVAAPPMVPQMVVVTQDTINSVGIDEYQLDDQLTIFPNPTRGDLNIRLEGGQAGTPLQLQLFNSVGALVDYEPVLVSEHDVQINIDQLESGFYFLMINYGDQRITRKISLVERF